MQEYVSISKFNWRHLLLLAVFFVSLVLVLVFAPAEQTLAYHNFADKRTFLGIPNFLDVISNLAFLITGFFGLKVGLGDRTGALRNSWLVLFAGIMLVSAGSGYYHWGPNNDTLVWDRLPMTVGFMGLFTALLGEYIDERLRVMLVPAVLTGLASVLYWHFFGDLRFYIWIQLVPLLTIPVIMILFRARYSHQQMLLGALGFYALAKVTEYYDTPIFAVTNGSISGHTTKHLLSAMGCMFIVLMLEKRKPLEMPDV